MGEVYLFRFPLGSHLFAAAYFLSLGLRGDCCLLKGPHSAGPMECPIVSSNITCPSPISLGTILFPYMKLDAGGLIREITLMNTLTGRYVTSHR